MSMINIYMIIRNFSNMHLYLDALDERNGTKSWLASMSLDEVHKKFSPRLDDYVHKKIGYNLKTPGTIDTFDGEPNYFMRLLATLIFLNKEPVFESPLTITLYPDLKPTPGRNAMLDPGGVRMFFHKIRPEKLDIMIVDHANKYVSEGDNRNYKFIAKEVKLNTDLHLLEGVHENDFNSHPSLGDTIYYYDDEVVFKGMRILGKTGGKWHLAL